MAETIHAVLDRIETQQAKALVLGPNEISLDLLRAVYRNNQLPLPTRMRAATAALPHEVPRLAVTAQVTEQGVAELLDRRLKRIQEMKRLENKVVNCGTIVSDRTNEPEPQPAPPTPGHLIDYITTGFTAGFDVSYSTASHWQLYLVRAGG